MAVRAEAVRALGQDFKAVVGEVVAGVMVHLREDNAGDLLGPSLGSLVSRASLKAIVTFALYADVLRVVRDVLLADGEISDDEVQEALPLLATLAAGFAGVKKEYAGYAALRAENVREFLEHYGADAKAFGHADESTKWAGFQVCRKLQAQFNDGGPLGMLGQWLVAWADRVVESNGVTASERDLLHSLRQQFLPQLQDQLAPAAKGTCTVEALDADERDYVRWRSQGRGSSAWLATRNDRIACWIEAAEAADPRGQLFVGLCHSFGIAVPENQAEAFRFFRAAADQGNAQALFCLGVCYSDGDGVAEDKQEAVRCYRAAADHGEPSALINLANCYRNGIGTTEDKEEAMRCYRAAADQGHPDALLALGVHYLAGDGVAEDHAEGWRLVLLAAQAGNQKAEELVRKHLGSVISDEAGFVLEMRLAAAEAVSGELAKEEATELLNKLLGVEQGISIVRKHCKWFDANGFPVIDEEGNQQIFTELAQTILHSAFATDDDVAARFEGLDGDLFLGGLTSLSNRVAEVVARHKGTAWLDGLKSLSAKRAKTLAQHEGTLSLSGLLTLSDEAASELACHQGELFLDNVVNVSERGVEVLGRHGGPVSLKGLQFQKQLGEMRSLNDDTIESLASYRGDFVLNRLESLTEIEARSIVNRGELLSLNGLVSVSDEVAEVLAQHRGRVSLNGLKALSDTAASALAGLHPLPTEHWPESARGAYETTRSNLSVVLAFVEDPAGVDISTLERLTPDQARVLARCGWYLNLSGITELCDDVAEILGDHVGTLNLPNLRSITEAGVAAIGRHQGPLIARADVVPVGAIGENAN
jgi:TPR repeat protein